MTIPDTVTGVLEASCETDELVGFWFWWDGSASPRMRGAYHGEIVAAIEGGYYLLRFRVSDTLPLGGHEVVHIGRIAEERWSLFAGSAELDTAMESHRAAG